MSSEVMHSALGTRHLRWLSAVRPRVRGEENRKSKYGREMWYGWRSGPPQSLASATISMSLLKTDHFFVGISSPATILIESPHALAHFFNIYYIIYMVKKPASG
jgi:hypothetical protein